MSVGSRTWKASWEHGLPGPVAGQGLVGHCPSHDRGFHLASTSCEETMSTVVVRIDDEASWPPAVKHLLERHLRELAPNGAFRESACPSLVDAVVGRVRAALDGHKLLCVHCTRLTPDEVDDVRRNGLRPLSRKLCETKLRQRVAAGDFTE